MSLLYGYESTAVFCLAMFAGMALEGPISRLFASSLVPASSLTSVLL